MKINTSRIFILLIFAGAGLRLFGLNIHSLWFDEGCTVINSSYTSLPELWNNVITMQGGSERYQPLNIILLWGWRQLFGSSELALRLFPAILGILSLPAAWWAVRNAFGVKSARWGLAFFACSAYAVYYAQEVRPYSLMILLMTLLYGAFFHAHRARTMPSAILLGVAAALAFFGSIFSCFLIACLALADLVISWKDFRRCILRWLPSVLFCIPIALFYLSAKDVAGGTAGAKVPDLQQPVWQNAMFAVYGVLSGTTLGPSIESLRAEGFSVLKLAWLPLGLLGISVLTLFCAVLRRILTASAEKSSETVFAVRVLLTATLFMLGIQVLFAVVMNFNWQPRHTYWLLPILVLLLGWLVGETPKSAIWVLLLIGLNLYSIQQYWFNPDHRKDDLRGAAAFLRTQEIPVLNISTATLLPMYEYYGLAHAQQLQIKGRDLDGALQARGISEAWLINYRPYYSHWKKEEAIEAAIAPEFTIVEIKALKGVDLYKVKGL